jgi:hypothetical protein
MKCPTSKLKRFLQTYQAESKAFALQIKQAVAVYKQSNPGDFSTSPSESEDEPEASVTSKIPNTPKVNPIHINP